VIEVVIRGPGQQPRTMRLQGGVYGLGRANDNQIVLPDVSVSRRHARVLVDGGRALIEDLGSGNGTFVDGVPVREFSLEDGAEVVIEPFRLEFTIMNEGPSSAGFRPGRLEAISGAIKGQVFHLPEGGASLGRGTDQEFSIPDPGASRRHASFTFERGGWWVKDPGSVNGLYVNGDLVQQARLRSGDIVRVGMTQLRFADGDMEENATVVMRPSAGEFNQAAPTVVRPIASPPRGWAMPVLVLVMGVFVIGLLFVLGGVIMRVGM